MRKIIEDDYRVVYFEFPDRRYHETYTEDEDGFIIIFIDPRDSYQRQLRSAIHALEHASDEDFQKDNVQQIEYDRHHLPKDIPDKKPDEKFIKALEDQRKRSTRSYKNYRKY